MNVYSQRWIVCKHTTASAGMVLSQVMQLPVRAACKVGRGRPLAVRRRA